MKSLFNHSGIDNGIDFPVVVSATCAGGPTTHCRSFGEVEAACKKLAGKKVKEQFWDKGKQQLQPIVLRAGLLYESLYAFLPTLKQGHLYLPTPVDGRMPYVSLDDVGAVAAEILVRPDKVVCTLHLSHRYALIFASVNHLPHIAASCSY